MKLQLWTFVCLFVSQFADLQVQFNLSVFSMCQVETGRMEQFAIQQTFFKNMYICI